MRLSVWPSDAFMCINRKIKQNKGKWNSAQRKKRFPKVPAEIKRDVLNASLKAFMLKKTNLMWSRPSLNIWDFGASSWLINRILINSH